VTLVDVLHAVRHRWYVIVLVVLVFVGIGVGMLRSGGTYSTHTVITFTSADRSPLDVDNGSQDQSVIAFAGAVATEINGGRRARTYSLADAPQYGAGVRQGVIVSLRNEGSQWNASYSNATIDLQIVGYTRAWVQQRQERLLGRIMELTTEVQAASVRRKSARIDASVEPLSTEIIHVQPGRSAELMATAALAGAAALTSVALCVAADGTLARRRGRARGRRAQAAGSAGMKFAAAEGTGAGASVPRGRGTE